MIQFLTLLTKMNENDQQLKNELIRWIEVNLNDPEDEQSKQKALKIIKKYNWNVLCEFSENQWKELDGPLGIGISIYNKIQALKTLTKGNSIK